MLIVCLLTFDKTNEHTDCDILMVVYLLPYVNMKVALQMPLTAVTLSSSNSHVAYKPLPLATVGIHRDTALMV